MAELYVGLLKVGMHKDVHKDQSPMVFWDCCADQRGGVFSMTARDLLQLNDTKTYTMNISDEAVIYKMCAFGWYKWCHYFDASKVGIFLFQKACL